MQRALPLSIIAATQARSNEHRRTPEGPHITATWGDYVLADCASQRADPVDRPRRLPSSDGGRTWSAISRCRAPGHRRLAHAWRRARTTATLPFALSREPMAGPGARWGPTGGSAAICIAALGTAPGWCHSVRPSLRAQSLSPWAVGLLAALLRRVHPPVFLCCRSYVVGRISPRSRALRSGS